MRGMDRLQKLLYLIMVVLGIYILYKGGGLLLQKGEQQGAFDSGTVQRTLEDAALRTYVPGYTAVVEDREAGGLMSRLMQPALPVYSYLADGEMQETAQEAADGEMQEETAQESVDGEMQEETTAALVEGEVPDKPQEITEQISAADTAEEALSGAVVTDALREQLRDFNYLVSNYYIVDSGTSADAQLLDADTLLDMDLSLEQNPDEPQILIYHTHSQEAFADSEEGNVSHTIVGMGEVLKTELEECGYQVLHDTGVYDLVDGVLDRSAAYDYAREAVQKILEEYPSIEVVIDLHRDGVEGKKFVTEIDGKPTSMIMFFNGISRDSNDQPLYWLENPYITENLAFSLQLQLKAREQYPGYTRNIYLKAERFNLHLRPRSLLIEAGTQLNTVEEEQNAMGPLADLIHQVLSGV